MKLIISAGILVLICLLYMLIEWLYNKYKDDLNTIDEHTVASRLDLTRRINDLERKVNMNEQMINWLWEQVGKAKQKGKEQGKKKGEKK